VHVAAVLGVATAAVFVVAAVGALRRWGQRLPA